MCSDILAAEVAGICECVARETRAENGNPEIQTNHFDTFASWSTKLTIKNHWLNIVRHNRNTNIGRKQCEKEYATHQGALKTANE